MVLPTGGVPFDNHQIGVVAKGFFDHENDVVRRERALRDAEGMYARMRPEETPVNAVIDRALTWKYLQKIPWNRVGRMHDNVWLGFQLWQICNEFELEPAALDTHPELSQSKYCRYRSNTLSQLRQMLPVVIVTVLAGPRRKFKKTRKGYKKSFHILQTTSMLDDSERYALALPMIKTICRHGDKHNAIAENWRDIFCKRNFGSSFETLCELLRNFGLYRMNWIVARCNPAHAEYTEDPDTVRMWQNGVRYEVAMILRYLRKEDFPTPNNPDHYFCDEIDKDNYIACKCFLGGVELGDFPKKI